MTSRLCLFDLDGTLVAERTIERLARHFDLVDAVERAFDARDFEPAAGIEESVRIARLFAGVDAEEFADVCSTMEFRPGTEEVVRALKAEGFRIGVVSASYLPAATAARDRLDLDFAVAAEPIIRDGRLTGDLHPCAYTAADTRGCGAFVCKERVLHAMRTPDTAYTVAIGDGLNDLCMLRAADLGIALAAKAPAVRLAADVAVNDMRAIPAILQKYLARPVLTVR